MYSVDDAVWSDEWFCSLDQRQKLLYLYLLGMCSKCGIFEINVRKINFDLTNGIESISPYTHDEIVSFAGYRIKEFAPNKGIVVGFISYNWVRDKPLDVERNPLHKGLLSELRRYGLTFDKINEWSTHKIKYVNSCEQQTLNLEPEPQTQEVKFDVAKAFDEFWARYPKSCPRKVDKKKCLDKFTIIIRDAKDQDECFKSIMSGLDRWIQSDMWCRDNGQYIKAPLSWLRGQCWNDSPMKGNENGNTKGSNRTANSNFKMSDAEGIF